MKGSEKQIKWAEDIKAGAIGYLERRMAGAAEMEARTGCGRYAKLTVKACRLLKAQLTQGFEGIDSAAQIIDMRRHFAEDALAHKIEEIVGIAERTGNDNFVDELAAQAGVRI